MKKFSLPLSFVFFTALCSFSFAQERPAPSPAPQPRTATAMMAVPLPLPPAVEVEIKVQADSPINLTVDDAIKGRLPGTPLKVRNDGGSVVAAFVLRVDVEPFGLAQMVIVGPKGLGVGDARTHGLSMMNYREGSARPTVSVDFVQFADGKTWGEDSLGKSKHIAAYLKGRGDALARLQELLAGQDGSEIYKALETFSSASFAEPNLPAGRPPRYIDYSARGYEEVINILRRMPRNTELGRDLANRLESLPKQTDH